MNIRHEYRYYGISLLLGLLATAIFWTAMVFQDNRETEVLPVKAIESLPAFQMQDVGGITIRWGSQTLHLKPENGIWMVHTPGKPAMIADPEKIASLLDELSRTKLLRELLIEEKKDAEELALGIFDPKRSERKIYYGCEVILTDKSGKEVLNMMLGIAHFRLTEQFGRYSATIPDGRYARLVVNGEPHYFLISRVLDECMPNSSIWINQYRCYVNDLPNLIRYSNLNDSSIVWEIKRNGRAHILTLPQGEKLSPRNVEEKLAYLLKEPLSRDIAASGVDFKPETMLYIEFQNGFSYTLEMQNGFDEMERYGRLTPAYDPAKTARLHNETDEAFAKRKAQYERELEREKKLYGGHIFILRPQLITIFEKIPSNTR